MGVMCTRAHRIPRLLLTLSPLVCGCSSEDRSHPTAEPVPLTASKAKDDASRASPANDEPLFTRETAMDALLNVERLDWLLIGRDGHISHSTFAFRVIMEQPDAADLCEQLLSKGSLAGKLYGLAGLSVRAPERCAVAETGLAATDDTVETQAGCILASYSIADAIRFFRIGDGRFAQTLISGRLDN